MSRTTGRDYAGRSYELEVPIREIRSLLPVVGDWFMVHFQYHADGSKFQTDWAMERVISWALVRDHEIHADLMKAVTACNFGFPVNLAEEGSDVVVKGDDMSPTGKTWSELFRAGACSASDFDGWNFVTDYFRREDGSIMGPIPTDDKG